MDTLHAYVLWLILRVHPFIKLMGIETSAEHGGAESSFTSAIIAIEELARVDPSV